MFTSQLTVLEPVYPRWRGELTNSTYGVTKQGGLSPLARGTRTPAIALETLTRFIPAGAGNSTCVSCSCAPPTVYPRWRGELRNPLCVAQLRGGLSPLARGTRMSNESLLQTMRFIPAGAGNSMQISEQKITGAVYPRWRGELSIGATPASILTGLSPLARGTRRLREAVALASRFIPAGAGNSMQ